MFKTDFKLAVRNILRSKGFSFLNIAGLSLSMAVGFVMLLFVRQETSYDRFHDKSERIFRISTHLSAGNREMDFVSVPGPFGPKLKESIPGVLSVVRMRSAGEANFSLPERRVEGLRFVHADQGFFDLFTFRTVQGEATTMLAAPYSLVLADDTARRLFGREDPVGRIVKVNDRDSYTVTGVIGEMPANSHFRFDALGSLSTLRETRRDLDTWAGYNYITYLELRPGVSPAGVLPIFQKVLDENTPEQIKAVVKRADLGLQRLTQIHLRSRTMNELSPPGNPALIRALSVIALFILILAGINFVNLSTARAVRRAKEVGVRKVLGAERRRLVVQFLGESVLLCVLSLTAAVGLIYLILPLFNQLITPSLVFRPFHGGFVLPALLGMAVLVGLLAGLYPAFVLARYGPRDALKPASSPKRGRRRFRSVLVTFQYVVSIALVCCTLIVQGQLQYVKNYNVGYEKEQVVEIPLLYQLAEKSEVFKSEVARLTGVEGASLCESPPGRVDQENLFRFEGSAEGSRLVLPTVDTDGDYLKTLGLTLAAGRDFSKDLATDTKAVLLNETLVRALGWDNPLGKTVKMIEGDPDRQFVEVPYTVIGVVRDYNFESLHAPIRGQVMMNLNRSIECLLVRLRTQNLPDTLKEIERVAEAIAPNRPFRAAFLSESFDQMYRSEERICQVFISFSLLALFVAGLGLFGLAAYTAESRTKEIGIRKAMGASVPSVILLLTKDFVRWVLLANLIAWPVAFVAMKNWTRSFAYRAEFNPLVFLASGALALVLAVVTVSLKTARAAAADPVQSLRYE